MLTIHDSFNLKESPFDITAYGEVLLDMISREEAPLKECANFTRYFGGSPANVLVNMQRLDNKTAFISRVGKDEFGEYLTEILEDEGVNLDCLQYDQEQATPIIFVNKSKETPSWLAYRGADINIEITDEIVILTLGKDGVLLSDGSTEPLHIPVFSEKVVDVTGAGDSFWSGFLSGILKGLTIKDSAKLGNAVAAFKIQGVGALSSVPPLMEIMSYYNIKPAEGGKFNE